MIEQSWIMGLLGGLLIGCASALLLLANGRIAGISGLVARILPPWHADGAGAPRPSAVAFVAGIAIAPLALAWLDGPVPISVTDSLPLLIAGGLLVGFGTRLGSGCTSGHGVCGLSRGSPRSLVAVAVFMGVAALTTAVMRLTTGGIQ